MKNLTAKLLTATMTGMMLVAAPFSVFAAEQKAEEPHVTENMTEAAEEEFDMDAIMDDLLLQLQDIGLGDLLTTETTEEDTSLNELGDVIDFIFQFLSDADVRTSTIKYCLDSFAEDMTEEEKQEMADKLANLSMEDVENAGNAIQEAFSGDEFKAFLDEVEDIVNEKKEMALKESAEEIDKYLDDLGQMLISITAEDIMNYMK